MLIVRGYIQTTFNKKGERDRESERERERGGGRVREETNQKSALGFKDRWSWPDNFDNF